MKSSDDKPLYVQIFNDLRQQIIDGRLEQGGRLPSIRQLAKDRGISRITVANAYRNLELEGLIETFERKGTFVASRDSEPPSQLISRDNSILHLWERRLKDSSNPARGALLNEILDSSLSDDQIIPFCWGAGDISLFPLDGFRIIINRILRTKGHKALGAECVEGSEELRTVLADYLKRLGVPVHSDGLVLTTGSQQAIMLLADVLLNRGDSVVVETPTWPGALEAFAAKGATLISVPVDEKGMQVELLEPLLKKHQPKLIYTVPTFHNPTGAVMSLERRQRLIQLAQQFGIPVLEDDALREIRFGVPIPPPLAALDNSGNTVNIGSFTKALLPAARIGYMVGSEHLLKLVVSRKRWTDLFCSPLMQYALSAYLQSGEAVSFWKRINRIYASRQEVMHESLIRYFPHDATWNKVSGGPQIWVKVSENVSVRRVFDDALRAGVSFAPGEAFFAVPEDQPYIRLNFAAIDEKRIERGVCKLGGLLLSHLQSGHR